MTEVTFTVLRRGARAVRGDPDTDRAGRHRRDRRRPVHAIALRCQVRIEPLRRNYSDDEADGPDSTCSDPGTLGHHPAHVPVAAHAPPWCRGSPAPPRSTCRWSAPTTSRWRPSKYLHALRDGTVPLQFLFSGTVFVTGHQRVLRAAGAVGPRGPLRHAGVGVARPDPSSTSRTPAGCDWTATPSTRSPATSPRTGCCRLDDAVTVAARARRQRGGPMTPRLGPGPRRRRRGALRGLSALPVPRDVAQEPVPLAVRRAGPAGRRAVPASARTTRCRLQSWSTGARRRCRVVVRFLQLQHRAVERATGDGRSRTGRRTGRRRSSRG